MNKPSIFKKSCIVIFLITTCFAQLQAQKKCATSEFRLLQIKKDPDIKQKRAVLQKKIEAARIQNEALKKTDEDVITIPVVFHVVYQNENENVEVEKLTSQFEVLNKDFRRKNEDTTDVWPQAADPKIEFCMANIDIDGNYFNGITRTKTNIDYFEYQKDSIFTTAKGGKDIWPGYLNIYVCDLDIYTTEVGGYSSLPGYAPEIDGVVLDYRVTGLFGALFWPYFGGRTATHEVGHWLNLEHPWGPTENYSCTQDDDVEDTPDSLLPYASCDAGSTCGSLDMAENFMDYHFDYCMNLFTEGQAERMRTSIIEAPSRQFIANHSKCETCYETINVNYHFGNETVSISVTDSITAENAIDNSSDIDYNAGSFVALNSGFSVDASSDFFARIDTCILN